MELGAYTFGSAARDEATGRPVSSAQAQRNLVEAIKVADEVGLDYFGIGEHHTEEMPASTAATVLAAGASITSSITLASAVTVLSTEDPVRVYQQFATLDAVSHGRAEITAGRGSSIESFPLFGYDLRDYDELYAEKLDLHRPRPAAAHVRAGRENVNVEEPGVARRRMPGGTRLGQPVLRHNRRARPDRPADTGRPTLP